MRDSEAGYPLGLNHPKMPRVAISEISETNLDRVGFWRVVESDIYIAFLFPGSIEADIFQCCTIQQLPMPRYLDVPNSDSYIWPGF